MASEDIRDLKPKPRCLKQRFFDSTWCLVRCHTGLLKIKNLTLKFLRSGPVFTQEYNNGRCFDKKANKLQVAIVFIKKKFSKTSLNNMQTGLPVGVVEELVQKSIECDSLVWILKRQIEN